jgi:hypothetical protein
MELSKNFEPGAIEEKWTSHWKSKRYFNSTPDDRKAFTVVIPPPNVTGALHIGHALTAAIEVSNIPHFQCSIFLFKTINANVIYNILHAGYDDSLAKNVWIQYFVGAWDGSRWNCYTGSISKLRRCCY